MDRSAREIAAEAVPVEQAPQGARRRPNHRDMPDRRGGDFFDRLDHAPGGSLGATEEGRPLRQDRPHLPHPARNRLKTVQGLAPEGAGPSYPAHPPDTTGNRMPGARRAPGRSIGPSCPTSPHIVIPSSPSPAPIAVPRPVLGAKGPADTGPRRCIRPGARRRIAASSSPTAPRPRSGRIPIPADWRSRGRMPASRHGHDVPAVVPARREEHRRSGQMWLAAILSAPDLPEYGEVNPRGDRG